MKPSDETAIAKFLDAGGRVSHVKETVEVSEPELLRFLADCGIVVTYRAEGRCFRYQGKRITLSALVPVANRHRSLIGLPPFALRT